MLTSSVQRAVVTLTLAAAMLSMPAPCNAGRILDCLFGTPAPAVAPAYMAPPCVTPGYAPGCVPQTCGYAPVVAYRPFVQRVGYAPVAAYSPYAGAMTAYRPMFGLGYESRLVPYTTYRMAYTPAVPYGSYYTPYRSYYTPYRSYYTPYGSNYSPYASNYGPSASCATPCSSCPSACESGGYGTAYYGAPASGCVSCAASSTSNMAPYTVIEAAPATSGGTPSSAAAPKTYQENKPVAEPELKPIPQPELKAAPQPQTKPSSTSAPQLIDPENRTAAAPIRQAARVELIGLPTQSSPARENAGWRASKD